VNQLTVKIACIFLILQVRYKLGLLSQQAVPVNTLKEDMFLHLLHADGAEAFQRIVLKQTENKILGIIRWRVLFLIRPFYALCPSDYMKQNLYNISFKLQFIYKLSKKLNKLRIIRSEPCKQKSCE